MSDDAVDALVDDLADGLESDVVQEHEHAELIEEIISIAREDAARDGLLFFDLETIPNEELFPRPDIAEPSDQSAAISEFFNDKKNTVDGVKAILQSVPTDENIELMLQLERDGKARKGVFDAIESFQKSLTEEFDKWSKLALNPIACRIVAIGWAIGDGDVRAFGVPPDFDIERAILSAWWELFGRSNHRKHCGFNQVAFDAQVIGFRSVSLGVRPKRSLDRRKYGNPQAVDVYQMLFPQGSPGGCDCKSICRSLGIEIPAGDMDGSQVLGLVDIGDFDRLTEYVASDVTVERELFYRTADTFGHD